jgi:hypothetical protein
MSAIGYCVAELPRLARRNPFNAAVYPVTALEEVERVTHLHFPPGSVLISGKARHSWTAPALYAEIRLPRSQLDSFQKQASLESTSAKSSPLRDPIPAEFDLGWRLERLQHPVGMSGGDVMRRGRVEALVGLDDPTTGTLFLCWQHD